MSAAEHLTAALAELRAGVELLDEDAGLEALAEIAHLLDQVKAAAGDARDLLHGAMAVWMGEPTMPAGRFRLESHRGAKRKHWQSDSLLGEVARRSCFDPATGEELPGAGSPAWQRLHALVASTLPITPSTGWKTTGLDDAGIDPNDYCEWAPGRSTVTVHLVDPEEGEAA